METAIFTQALTEYFRLRRISLWVVLCVLCAILALYWSKLQTSSTPEQTYTSVVSLMVFHIVALASAIFTTAIVSQEIEQRTIVYLLTRPVPRWKLLLVRYVASVVVVFFVGLVGILLTAAASHYYALVGKDLVAIFVGAMAYGALFLVVSLFFNRAMLICLLYAFGWETSVPNMPGEMFRLSVYSYMQGIAQHPASEMNSKANGLFAGASISPLNAWLVMIAAIVLLLGLGAFWFTTNEFVPREDAE